MKHALSLLPGPTNDTLELGYAVELSGEDVYALQTVERKLTFQLRDLQAPKFMMDRELHTISAHPDKEINLYETDPWSLARDFAYRFFNVQNLREAYIFQRKIMHFMEDLMIMQVPLSPFKGFTQTFDVRVDIPKEIGNFENFRRSIIVRPR